MSCINGKSQRNKLETELTEMISTKVRRLGVDSPAFDAQNVEF